MARRPRWAPPYSFSHVTATGNRREAVFNDDIDREFFLTTLRHYMAKCASKIHAYCLMTTHLHLLVEVDAVPLSTAMQRVLQVYAQRFNRRYQYRGHVFADRFWSRPCETDPDLLEVLRYIHLNPVQAGIVGRPELYPWTSHHAYLHPDTDGWVATDSILRIFAQSPEHAVREYTLFLEEELSPHPRRVGFE